MGTHALPYQVTELIKKGCYDAAAEQLVLQSYPFNFAVKLLSNSPHALASYYYKSATSVNATSSHRQVLAHLYLETKLFIIGTMNDEEKRKEIDKIKIFINQFKQYLDPKSVIHMVKSSGEKSLLASTYISFGEYKAACAFYLYNKDFAALSKLLPYLPVEMQREVLLTFLKYRKDGIFEVAENHTIHMNSLYDSLVGLVVSAPTLIDLIQDNTIGTFEEYVYEMSTPIQFSMFFLLLANLDKKEKIKYFLSTPEIKNIDPDYVSRILGQQHKYLLASDILSKFDNKHITAVKYAIKDMIETVNREKKNYQAVKNLNDLLCIKLKNAPDIKKCWLAALRECNRLGDFLTPKNWDSLISHATRDQLLNLDDIFPLIPADMPLDSLHQTISNAVDTQSRALHDAEEGRRLIGERMKAMRAAIDEGGIKDAIVDPMSAECCVCHLPLCDYSFDVFPCGHSAHSGCTKQLSGGIDTARSCPVCGLAALECLSEAFVGDSEDPSCWDVPAPELPAEEDNTQMIIKSYDRSAFL